MRCVTLQGQRLMARDLDRQAAELQIRIAVLSRYSRWADLSRMPWGNAVQGERDFDVQTICATEPGGILASYAMASHRGSRGHAPAFAGGLLTLNTDHPIVYGQSRGR